MNYLPQAGKSKEDPESYTVLIVDDDRVYILKTDTNECLRAALRALAYRKSYFTAR
jgi:hypothetical protein